jgi:hypothetical protein
VNPAQQALWRAGHTQRLELIFSALVQALRHQFLDACQFHHYIHPTKNLQKSMMVLLQNSETA